MTGGADKDAVVYNRKVFCFTYLGPCALATRLNMDAWMDGCTLTIVVGPPDLHLPPQHQRTRQEEVVVDRLKGHSKKVGRYR